MKEFLEKNGYENWNSEEEWIGRHQTFTNKYQKRVDETETFAESLLCLCNDKLFINIVETIFNENPHYEISMAHENGYGEWCDLKIYSLSSSQIQENLVKYEQKLKKLWDVFCE